MLTRKHFEELAMILKQCQPTKDDSLNAFKKWRESVTMTIIMCKRANPRFNSGTFKRACGVED